MLLSEIISGISKQFSFYYKLLYYKLSALFFWPMNYSRLLCTHISDMTRFYWNIFITDPDKKVNFHWYYFSNFCWLVICVSWVCKLHNIGNCSNIHISKPSVLPFVEIPIPTIWYFSVFFLVCKLFKFKRLSSYILFLTL